MEVTSSEKEEEILLQMGAEKAEKEKQDIEAMLARDNLKIKTVAKYKAIKANQM